MWEHGLPAKGNFVGQLYNEPSQCLVASFQEKFDDQQWSEDLYYRHRTSTQYRQVPGSGAGIHYAHVVSSAKLPIILFNVTRWSEHGGDWESLSSFNLTTLELRTEVTRASFCEPEFEGVWVSSLISAREDASSVFCTVAFEKRLISGDLKVDYWLCELRLADFALTKITSLGNIFA